MRTYGKRLKFFIVIIFVGSILLMARGGKFSPILNKIEGFLPGKKELKLTFKDYEFKPVSRQAVSQKVLATGTVSLKTGAEVKIGARISGQLEKLKVKIGDIVKAGDIIATIEHKDLLARVDQFAADLKPEEARLSKVKQEGPLKINKLKAALAEKNVQINLAQKMLSRNQSLNQEGIVSETIVDEVDDTRKTLKFLTDKLIIEEELLSKNLGVFVIHNKDKKKYSQFKNIDYMFGEMVKDNWIVYPWDAKELHPNNPIITYL